MKGSGIWETRVRMSSHLNPMPLFNSSLLPRPQTSTTLNAEQPRIAGLNWILRYAGPDESRKIGRQHTSGPEEEGEALPIERQGQTITGAMHVGATRRQEGCHVHGASRLYRHDEACWGCRTVETVHARGPDDVDVPHADQMAKTTEAGGKCYRSSTSLPRRPLRMA